MKINLSYCWAEVYAAGHWFAVGMIAAAWREVADGARVR